MNKLLYKTKQAIMDISVIICAYTEKRWDDLLAAVASIQQQTHQARETIVVIDHNPQLFQRARTMFPGVMVIENQEACGLSGARNSGIAIAKGAVVAFMDEDAIAEPSWLAHLAAGYEDKRVMGVGGAIVPTWESGRPAWFPQEFDWVVGCTYQGMSATATVVRNLIGCNMSFRRSLFATVGGFRHGMGRIGTRPLGCEETEFCIRAQQQWPTQVLLYEPLARVHHYVPSQRANWRYFQARCYAEGLSKAQVAHLVGTQDGLAAERRYTLHTLPLGALRGVSDGIVRGDLSGFGRAIAITAGLAITTAGYSNGRFRQLTQKETDSSQWLLHKAKGAI